MCGRAEHKGTGHRSHGGSIPITLTESVRRKIFCSMSKYHNCFRWKSLKKLIVSWTISTVNKSQYGKNFYHSFCHRGILFLQAGASTLYFGNFPKRNEIAKILAQTVRQCLIPDLPLICLLKSTIYVPELHFFANSCDEIKKIYCICSVKFFHFNFFIFLQFETNPRALLW